MGLATIDPHSQKEHTEIYKILKFGVYQTSFYWGTVEVFSRFGLWRDFLNDKFKQQFLHSDWLKTCQLIPNKWDFTSATLNHISFRFLSQYER